MSEIEKKSAYVKVTAETPLYIDFKYWKSKEPNWRSILVGYLCEEHRAVFGSFDPSIEPIDAVDPETGEVKQIDVILDLIFTHCSQQEGFVPENGPLTECIFRMLLANGNSPLTPAQMSEKLNKPSNTIVKTLTSRVYRGIRPY